MTVCYTLWASASRACAILIFANPVQRTDTFWKTQSFILFYMQYTLHSILHKFLQNIIKGTDGLVEIIGEAHRAPTNVSNRARYPIRHHNLKKTWTQTEHSSPLHRAISAAYSFQLILIDGRKIARLWNTAMTRSQAISLIALKRTYTKIRPALLKKLKLRLSIHGAPIPNLSPSKSVIRLF